MLELPKKIFKRINLRYRNIGGTLNLKTHLKIISKVTHNFLITTPRLPLILAPYTFSKKQNKQMLWRDSPALFGASAFLGRRFACTVYPLFCAGKLLPLVWLVVWFGCGKWQGRTEAVAVADSFGLGGLLVALVYFYEDRE